MRSWAGWAGLFAGKEEKASGLKWLRAKEVEERERERERRVLSFFSQISFKFNFQTFKLQSNKNPCIQIMMHKHLLSLNYFSDVLFI
jgi:hypothetical protein